MSDWRDVMNAQSEADSARRDLDNYGGMIEDGREGDVALAVLMAAKALCLQLRVVGVLVDYNGGALCNAAGRP